jgi:energy-converting hydrogenase Eha subunit A
MTPSPRRATPFIALGIAFVVIGISGQRAFIYVGIVFMIIGVVESRRAR